MGLLSSKFPEKEDVPLLPSVCFLSWLVFTLHCLWTDWLTRTKWGKSLWPLNPVTPKLTPPFDASTTHAHTKTSAVPKHPKKKKDGDHDYPAGNTLAKGLG